MGWKDLISDYFRFTRKDRIALLVIASLLAFVILFPYLSGKNTAKKEAVLTDTAWIAAAKKLESLSSVIDTSDNNNHWSGHFVERNAAELFLFDPNSISVQEWSRLGLRDKTIKTIQHYLQKGGKFRTPEDLKRVYGMREEDFERLSPYIRISGDEHPRQTEYANQSGYRPALPLSNRVPTAVDINTADTTAWIALPGIGSKLANRIINFRDKLGGFYSIEQVKETFGLADSVFQKIKPFLLSNTSVVRKIKINTCTVEELKNHPYLRYAIGNAIIAYRNQHGLFSKVEELKNIIPVTEAIYQKMLPYLEL